jgi:hypothetical protein
VSQGTTSPSLKPNAFLPRFQAPPHPVAGGAPGTETAEFKIVIPDGPLEFLRKPPREGLDKMMFNIIDPSAVLAYKMGMGLPVPVKALPVPSRKNFAHDPDPRELIEDLINRSQADHRVLAANLSKYHVRRGVIIHALQDREDRELLGRHPHPPEVQRSRQLSLRRVFPAFLSGGSSMICFLIRNHS